MNLPDNYYRTSETPMLNPEDERNCREYEAGLSAVANAAVALSGTECGVRCVVDASYSGEAEDGALTGRMTIEMEVSEALEDCCPYGQMETMADKLEAIARDLRGKPSREVA